MTTINTIEDLARLLREQPAWREAIRSLVLSEDLVELPARFDRFVEAQGEVSARLDRNFEALQESHTRLEHNIEVLQESYARIEQNIGALQESYTRLEHNIEVLQESYARLEHNIEVLQESYARIEKFIEEQQETNRLVNLRLNNIEGRLGNLDGGEYERRCRSRALSRTLTEFGFVGPYFALLQGGHTDPRLVSSLSLAINSGAITRLRTGDLLETDVIISADDNRHAVFEVSITADNDDIHRARARAEILAQVTGGEVTSAVFTSNLSDQQREQADAENVSVFVAPYP